MNGKPRLASETCHATGKTRHPRPVRAGDLPALNGLFVEYLNFGGYPEVALSPVIRADPARYVRQDIIDKVLLRDLPSLYGISDIQELNSLFTALAYNTANEVSLDKRSQRARNGRAR